jgi:hypothetical protein
VGNNGNVGLGNYGGAHTVINGPSYRLKDHLAVTKGGGPLE